ncbi:MAG TPA: hypothetical protein VFB76_05785 [Candidatus Angelobacter sp.]|nr:hypothetical protein [Candidatus Angelobacter sp.]
MQRLRFYKMALEHPSRKEYLRNFPLARPLTPLGPIYASGIYDECYRRNPWHGAVPPEFVTTGVCTECSTSIHDGISIPAVEGAPLAFCCNLHYLDWWKHQHPGEDLL